MKITEVFNSKAVRKAKRQVDLDYGRAARLIGNLDIEGKQEMIKKIEAGYVKAYKKLIAGIDPTKPIKEEAPAKKVAKKVPAKKAAKKSGGKKKAEATADAADLTA